VDPESGLPAEQEQLHLEIHRSLIPTRGPGTLDAMSKVYAAVVQAAPVLFDREATIDKVCRLVKESAKQGAQLVVFPEAFVGGYPKSLDFGARVGTRLPEGREVFQRYWEGAVEIPGAATEQIGAAAREHGQHLVVGVVERDGGTLYCTVLFFDDEGRVVGKHRKLVPTAMERLIWGSGDGSSMSVVQTPHGRLGAAICWENYMPLLRMHMYSMGIELYCAPTVDDRETWFPTMRHVALEGRCFVLSACQYLTREDCPDDYGSGLPPELIRGGSCIVDPLGQVLAGPCYGKEVILTAELDREQIVRGKFDLDVSGHYARPDVFCLVVDERPKQVVVRESPPSEATERHAEGKEEEPSTQPFRRSSS
jgi:nitrilase